MITLNEKIRGAFLGIAIGDRLGMPVETYSPAKIDQVYPEINGRVDRYLQPRNHKFFADDYNDTTDDWDYTEATAEAFIRCKSNWRIDPNSLMTELEKQCKRIYIERKARGCGGTTRKAIEAMIAGASWNNAAPTGPADGWGNGVAMKIFPMVAALFVYFGNSDKYDFLYTEYTRMTHSKSDTVSTTYAMAAAYKYCLALDDPLKFNVANFVAAVVAASAKGMAYMPLTIKHNVTQKLCSLIKHQEYNVERIIADFGGGSPNACDSIPFTLMHLVKEPPSINTLYEVVSNGGDTDSNGSMIGGLLGALYGTKIFPQHLVDGLISKDNVTDIANKFIDRF
jgi:ADP-ribosylglycohydrolase